MRPSIPIRSFAAAGLAAAALALPPAAFAGDRVEVTPTLGYRSNPIRYPSPVLCLFPITIPCAERAAAEDDATFGLLVDVPLRGSWMLELRIDRQASDVKLDAAFLFPGLVPIGRDIAIDTITVTVGGLYGWSLGKTEPFVSFGAGLADVDPDLFAFAPPELDGAYLALSLGGGVKLFPEHRLGLRLEARGLWIDLPSAVDNQVAVEATTGLIIRF